MRRTVSVIGSGENATAKQKEIAEELGRLLARKGFVILCGGRKGVMGAVGKGAREAGGGLVIGILPGYDKKGANRHLDVAITTGIGFARNQIIAYSGDVIIAVGGEAGTLNEMAFAWAKGKRIIAIRSSGGVAARYAGKKMDSRKHPAISSAGSAREAVEMAERILSTSPSK